MPKPLAKNKIDRLNELRAMNLSNHQIAIEMGLSPVTVRKYLGKEKLMSRAEYGSIVSHITGDTFVKGMDGMAKKIENPGLSVSVINVRGKDLEYRIEVGKGIMIRRNNTDQLYIPNNELPDFIKEISWLAERLSQDKLPL